MTRPPPFVCSNCRHAFRSSKVLGSATARTPRANTAHTTLNVLAAYSVPRPNRPRLFSSSPSPSPQASSSKPAPSPKDILSTPTWSVSSLLDTPAPPTPTKPASNQGLEAQPNPEDEITPQKLHHLLRLSALPVPKDAQAEKSLLASLHSHLRFVRQIQAVDTSGVEPLRALRDETQTGRQQATIGLEDLRGALESEVRFGHRKRPRRVKRSSADGKGEEETLAAEDWDPLSTAGRTAGKYFVVQSKKGE